MLVVAILKIIHKKLKKSHIFNQIFLYLFSHILRTTSSPLLIFIPHIVEQVYCVMKQTANFYRHSFFFHEFLECAAGLGENEILKIEFLSPFDFVAMLNIIHVNLMS